MFIRTESVDFVPKKFVVYNFYGEDTFFCWEDDKLALIRFTKEDFGSASRVLKAPASIRKIQCFRGRIFLICIPRGVYKLSRGREFAVLSKNAIGMGALFYQVLISKHDYLYLDNKENMSSKLLFHINSPLSELCVFPLSVENAHTDLLDLLSFNQNDKSLCIVANGKQLFKIGIKVVNIIYNCDFPIVDILSIQRGGKAIGLLLLLNANTIVIMYPKKGKLQFDKVHLATRSKAICATMSHVMEDTMWIIYCDEYMLHFLKKTLSIESAVQKVNSERKSFLCLKPYKSVILALTDDKQLIEISLESIERQLILGDNDFVDISPDMLKDTTSIVSAIYDKTKEYQILNQNLLMELDKLRRINLYACKQKIQVISRIEMQRISNKSFLTMRFQNALPKNTYIILSLLSEQKRIFFMKAITDSPVSVEMQIPEMRLYYSMRIAMDLVTLLNEGDPWCIIKDFINDISAQYNRKRRSRKDRSSFVIAKLTALKNLIINRNINMDTLSQMKKTIRKEICDF